MDKSTFYKILDIDGPDEFIYYDNLSALLEEDAYIDEELINELLIGVDKEILIELIDTYFDEFLKAIPDNETDLYITVESISRALSGQISENMNENDIISLTSELIRFRKWYVNDSLVMDKIKGKECSVRDARYDIIAAGLLGEKYDFDFAKAYDYELEGYDFHLGNVEIKGEDFD